jgi:hypothetical protein
MFPALRQQKECARTIVGSRTGNGPKGDPERETDADRRKWAHIDCVSECTVKRL